ncbi:MAG: glutathione S-transferase family protein [Actinobacteria bacterium]|nr:glutathione S-transferase family protein [Actinomycetota bacterium]
MNAPPQLGAETDSRGRFVRQQSAFRDRIEEGGEHPPEAGRYHLYVSLACPWAHRVVIARRLKGLEDVIGMTVVDPIRDERGWALRDGTGWSADPVTGFAFLAEAYAATDPGWRGRVTVPVLWDTATGTIVNNESEDILRILDSAFGDLALPSPVLRPPELAASIDVMNARVYPEVNNAVYRAGFAASQEAYDEAVADLAAGLAMVEENLARERWLVGNRFTEADIRLFTTLVRFDAVYHTHFKCNARLIAESAALVGFVRDVAQVPGVMDTIAMDQIKSHYYGTHQVLNPSGIIPVSDGPDLSVPHGRSTLGPEAVEPPPPG